MKRPSARVDLAALQWAMSSMRMQILDSVRSGFAGLNPGIHAGSVIAYLYLVLAEATACRSDVRSALRDVRDSFGLEVLRANPGIAPFRCDPPAIRQLYDQLLDAPLFDSGPNTPNHRSA